MLAIGILLILASVFGFISGAVGYGDIGLAFFYCAVVSMLAGFGFIIAHGKMKK